MARRRMLPPRSRRWIWRWHTPRFRGGGHPFGVRTGFARARAPLKTDSLDRRRDQRQSAKPKYWAFIRSRPISRTRGKSDSGSSLILIKLGSGEIRKRRCDHDDRTSSHPEQSHTPGWGKHHVGGFTYTLWVTLSLT